MSFPKGLVCVTLIDFPVDRSCTKAAQIYLPFKENNPACKNLFAGRGPFEKHQNIYVRIGDLPPGLAKCIFEENEKGFNCCMFLFSNYYERILGSLNETELIKWCRNRKVIKWVKLLKKVQESSTSKLIDKKLLYVCSIIMSNSIGESEFKRQMRMVES